MELTKIDLIRKQMVAEADNPVSLNNSLHGSDAYVARWYLSGALTDDELMKRIKELNTTSADKPNYELKVTDVIVFPFKNIPDDNDCHMRGFASIVLNEQINIRGLKIMSGNNGLFVGYPNDPFYKGEDFRHLVSPLTKNIRDEIENAVLTKYQEEIDK